MSARKRARTDFAAPTEDDDNPSLGAGDPSSSARSTRPPRYTSVPSLISLCSRRFADHYVRLRNREELWDKRISTHLINLPETLLPRVLADLIRVCPTYLKHEFLVTYFFRGSSLVLGGIPGVTNHTIRAIERTGADLRDLELSGFNKVPDNLFAGAIHHLPNLRRLVLRGCSLVGPKTMAAAAKSCKRLQIVNFNYTSITPASLQPLLLACSTSLLAVKLAGIPNWTDTTFRKMLSADLSLPQLVTLKLCRLNISEAPLNELLGRCPSLRRLDISFTAVRHPFTNSDHLPPLVKLYLTSTSIPNAELLSLLPQLSSLTSLALGALGA
ncbi:hypothetical protein C8F01DRAFT_427617 [Mycena amicta]|nr:hypothetical protein C8F01DRAFT_427617 [Mycena amicta]